MIKVLVSFLFFLFTYPAVFAGGDLLNKEVTVAITGTPLKYILEKIEVIGQVQFSYNPSLIDENRVVSLNLKNQTIGFGLSLIFDESVRFKEVGNHIVLLKKEEKSEIRARKKKAAEHTFTGIITDTKTGEPIDGASIYDVEAKYAAATNTQGVYKLIVPHSADVRSLYFKRKGYNEKVIVVDLSKEIIAPINISLERELENMEHIYPVEIARLPQGFTEKAVSGILISDETYIHGENLDEIKDERIFQISLVPSVSIGSNLSTNGLITNNISLNAISGYSSGVNGVELGGILNIVKGDVQYVQAAGISNLVGGNVIGVQAAGIKNSVTGNVKGVQAAGIANTNKQNVTGVQAAGIANLNRGGFTGCQVSGIYNHAKTNSVGVQVAGIANMAEEDLYGAQISGISNMAKDGRNFLQLAGIANVSRINYGLQVSSIFNYTDHNEILQIGLINIAKKSRGVSLGLINFVVDGYHALELSSNTFMQSSIKLKSGVQRLYNTYGFGYRFGETPIYSTSFGLGTYFKIGEKLQSSIDVDMNLIWEEGFNSDRSSQLLSISPTLEYRLFDHMVLFGGPSANIHYLSNQKSDDSYFGEYTFLSIASDSNEDYKLNYWVGLQVGIRFF